MTMHVRTSISSAPAAHVLALARRFHDDWRQTYEAANGKASRLKRTTDRDWVARNNGSDEVDIAHAEFSALPRDWQQENLVSAQVVLALVESAALRGIPLDADFVETTSFEVHDQWLERNRSSAAASQSVTYDRLSEPEKENDRQQVRAAITLYQQGCVADYHASPQRSAPAPVAKSPDSQRPLQEHTMSDGRQNAGQKMGQKGAGKKRDQPGAPGEHTNQHLKTFPDGHQPAKPDEQAAPHEKDDKHR